jgi:RND family efflux transporter MFP subunit
LFRIDARDYQAAHDESTATAAQLEMAIQRLKKQQEIDIRRLKTLERNRDLAEAEFERLRTLFSAHQVGTRSGVDQAEQAYNAAVDQMDQMAQAVALYPIQIQEQKSSLDAAQARLTQTRTNLQRCVVRAPFSGRITDVSIEANQYASPGQSVVSLADDSVLEIRLPLDSRDARQWLQFEETIETAGRGWISGLKPVDCRILWTEDKTGSGWTGRLHRVVKFEPRTRTLTVAVRVDAPSAVNSATRRLPLVEGMFCEVRIPGRILERVYRVPRKAVNLDQTVYVAKDNRLHTVPVTVARYEGDSALVSQGLSDGDQVIITRLVNPLENSLLKITHQ